MTINLRLTSGDREALESVAGELRDAVRRKGARLAGPHSDAPEEYRLPLYARLDGDDSRRCGRWSYTVYTRRLTVSGRDELARSLLEREFPDSVHVEMEIEG
ncbi:MAG: 30S ribosomal protein S10 [Halobacteriaceae archaeon]